MIRKMQVLNLKDALREQYHTNPQTIRWTLTTLLMGAAFLLRIYAPELYMTGFDMPGHIMASLRLHLTSPFSLTDILSNSITQLLFFNHGYTTMLVPWFFYELLFGLAKFPITEGILTTIHSFLGILSLISVFYFLLINFGFRTAFLSTALLAVTPIHIGLSRVHVGNQILSSIFFFACLVCIKQFLDTQKAIWKYGYALMLFFYIGSENTFFAGLFLQALYFGFLSLPRSPKERFQAIRRLFFNPAVLIAGVFPIVAYLVAAYVHYFYNLEGGFIFRIINKAYPSDETHAPYQVVVWMIQLFGPLLMAAVVVGAIDVLKIKSRKNWKIVISSLNPGTALLLAAFCSYFILLNLSDHIERNYVFLLLTPTAVLASMIFLRSQLLYLFTLLTTLVYSLSVVYALPLPFPTIKNFGSTTSYETTSLQAMKTLGYLFRSGALQVSTVTNGPEKDIGLLTQYTSAFYYVGEHTSRNVFQSVKHGWLDAFGTYLLAYSLDSSETSNQEIGRIIREKKLTRIAILADHSKNLVELYANRPKEVVIRRSQFPLGLARVSADGTLIFDVQTGNRLFDQEFATIDQIPKLYLGHFGYKLPGWSKEASVTDD
jgi:hypothetical protein